MQAQTAKAVRYTECPLFRDWLSIEVNRRTYNQGFQNCALYRGYPLLRGVR